MTGFFKRDKTKAPESEAGGGAAEAEPTNYRAWSPADEEEAYMRAHGSPGTYAPPPLVMETARNSPVTMVPTSMANSA